MWMTLLVAYACATPTDDRYLEDFDFLQRTVQQRAGALSARDIDWKKACSTLRPRFEQCTSDQEHVANVMRLLAVLQDGHTGVTRTSISPRPSKWDGLFGGGLWLAIEDGRVLVRAAMDGHPHEKSLTPGTAIIAFDGLPTAWWLERERRRILTFQGVSSLHHLDATLANRGLPFGDASSVDVEWLHPNGQQGTLSLPKWGPGGKAFDVTAATLPKGIPMESGATAGWLDQASGTGYLRITGKMDAATRDAFHAAFDTLNGLQALVLDCRGMGGGSDAFAWDMAGRLFPDGVANGVHDRIEPTGSQPFGGPVVMLQDEREVSAAETFTWAVSETERVISVGRSTGGWAIIPTGFDCPSGLCSFRLGVRNRPTPIDGVMTEGVGWPADISLPRTGQFGAPGGELEVAHWIASAWATGARRDDVRKAFADLFGSTPKRFERAAKAWKKDGWPFDPGDVQSAVEDNVRETLALELQLLDVKPPDVLGSRQRYDSLVDRAKGFGLSADAKAWKKAMDGLKAEEAAQTAWLALVDETFTAEDDAVSKWQRKFGKTQWGRVVKEQRRSR